MTGLIGIPRLKFKVVFEYEIQLSFDISTYHKIQNASLERLSNFEKYRKFENINFYYFFKDQFFSKERDDQLDIKLDIYRSSVMLNCKVDRRPIDTKRGI